MSDIKRVPITGYEGLYSIDVSGNVHGLIQTTSRRKRIIKPYKNSGGYLRVNLYDKEGQVKKHYIHRLVAEAFIPNPLNLPVVNHLDADKKNNHVSNLEWCTQQENIDHSWEQNLQKNKYETKVTTSTGKVYHFNSMKEASLAIFGNHWLIGHLRRTEKSNEISCDGYLIKVGDAKCQG